MPGILSRTLPQATLDDRAVELLQAPGAAAASADRPATGTADGPPSGMRAGRPRAHRIGKELGRCAVTAVLRRSTSDSYPVQTVGREDAHS